MGRQANRCFVVSSLLLVLFYNRFVPAAATLCYVCVGPEDECRFGVTRICPQDKPFCSFSWNRATGFVNQSCQDTNFCGEPRMRRQANGYAYGYDPSPYNSNYYFGNGNGQPQYRQVQQQQQPQMIQPNFGPPPYGADDSHYRSAAMAAGQGKTGYVAPDNRPTGYARSGGIATQDLHTCCNYNHCNCIASQCQIIAPSGTTSIQLQSMVIKPIVIIPALVLLVWPHFIE